MASVAKRFYSEMYGVTDALRDQLHVFKVVREGNARRSDLRIASAASPTLLDVLGGPH